MFELPCCLTLCTSSDRGTFIVFFNAAWHQAFCPACAQYDRGSRACMLPFPLCSASFDRVPVSACFHFLSFLLPVMRCYATWVPCRASWCHSSFTPDSINWAPNHALSSGPLLCVATAHHCSFFCCIGQVDRSAASLGCSH